MKHMGCNQPQQLLNMKLNYPLESEKAFLIKPVLYSTQKTSIRDQGKRSK